jgi:predicted kinase
MGTRQESADDRAAAVQAAAWGQLEEPGPDHPADDCPGGDHRHQGQHDDQDKRHAARTRPMVSPAPGPGHGLGSGARPTMDQPCARRGVLMKGPTLFLTVGLPGTGKTTAARRIEVERRALRLTKDEWVKALYGPENPSTAQDVIEGRLVQVGLRALELGINVVIDYGLWSRDERSALRRAAADRGAAVEMRYFALDPAEQRSRLRQRQAQAPHATWPMSDEDLDEWAAQIDIPTPGELDGTEPVDDPPAGFATWEEWRSFRWPPSVS